MNNGHRKNQAITNYLVPAFLILITLAAYSQVYRLDFVNYDDGGYVYENPNVIKGLTSDNVVWAFTEYCGGNWHPLTMLSFMLDVELFGINPAAHHTVNLIFHLANTLLVFFIFQRATGRTWPSALVAVLFAIHPLHVESVAWIAERKDVLSTFFGLWAVAAYFHYARRPGFWRYASVAGLMLLSLHAKAMLVTLPILLLLLDVWPLGRIDLNGPKILTKAGGLMLEKIPLLVLSLVFGFVTILAQHQMGALQPLDIKPLDLRLMNAAAAYLTYLAKTVLPLNLAVIYPYPDTVPLLQVLLSTVVLFVITVLTIRMRKWPYLLVGWLWYLVSLAPVIGVIQVGMQSMADRYTYIPLVGIFVMAGFGLADLVQRGYLRLKLAVPVVAALIIALTILCYQQVGIWQNGGTLFRHAVSVTRNNHVAYSALGLFLMDTGKLHEAESNLLKAVAIAPRNAREQRILGEIYHDLQQWNKAERHLRLAIELNPGHPEGHFWLGDVLRSQGRFKEAEEELRRAVEISPTAQRHNFLGLALAQQNRLTEAEFHFREALRLDPGYSKARSNLEKIMQIKNQPKS